MNRSQQLAHIAKALQATGHYNEAQSIRMAVAMLVPYDERIVSEYAWAVKHAIANVGADTAYLYARISAGYVMRQLHWREA